MTKKVTKNIKVIDFIEKVGLLEFCGEPTDNELVNIVSALGECGYQTELSSFERRKHVHYTSYYRDEDEKPEVNTIYVLNIYKKITKEVME